MNKPLIKSCLLALLILAGLTSMAAQADVNTYNQGRTYNDTPYYSAYHHYYDHMRDTADNGIDNWGRLTRYHYYRETYYQLEAERQQLVRTYLELKATYDNQVGLSSQRLQQYQSGWSDLQSRFEQLRKTNPVVGGDYRIVELEGNLQSYQTLLQQLSMADFVSQYKDKLDALTRLDTERARLIDTWWESDSNYSDLNTNLTLVNGYIKELNQALQELLKDHQGKMTSDLQTLEDRQAELARRLTDIESRPKRQATSHARGSQTHWRSASRADVPLWNELRNEGDHAFAMTDNTLPSQPYRADLTAVHDLEALQAQSDKAHRLRAKEIVFTLQRSNISRQGDIDLSGAITAFIKEKLLVTPNARGVSSGFRWQMQTYDNERLTITLMPQYYMTDDQYKEYYDHLKAWTAQHIQSTDTEVEKIDKIQDYIMTNYHYATGKVGGVTRTGISVQTPYAFIKDKEAVCQAYAQLFKDMGQLAGLDVHYIQGYGDPVGGLSSLHAWNIVKVDGQYYHIDLTWNDTIDSTNHNHTYTLRGNDFMSKTHLWNAAYAISDSDYAAYPRRTFPRYGTYAANNSRNTFYPRYSYA
ncbi:transglutaminase domain-containing protein [Streptococcus equi]|uniref:transglutaminase domain-containing protein n=1 Tax=Streptococcus equi TaxID=1336 RepID=UPI0013F5A8B4|nr:transglutaminase domain-containing protein [Streptococcus equi]